jgi:hypothetical protein
MVYEGLFARSPLYDLLTTPAARKHALKTFSKLFDILPKQEKSNVLHAIQVQLHRSLTPRIYSPK